MNLSVQDIAFYVFLILCGLEIVILYYLIVTFIRIEKKVDLLLRRQQSRQQKNQQKK
jgi:hypothetical protein